MGARVVSNIVHIVLNVWDKHAKNRDNLRFLGKLRHEIEQLGMEMQVWGMSNKRELTRQVMLTHKPTHGEVVRLAERLEAEGVRQVITIGDRAFEAATGHTNADERQGYWVFSETLNVNVLPLGETLNAWDYQAKYVQRRILQTYARALSEGVPKRRGNKVERIDSARELRAWFSEATGRAVALDIELWDGVLRCIGLSARNGRSAIIPFATNKGLDLAGPERKRLLRAFAAEFASERAWIAQNAMFDFPALCDILAQELGGHPTDYAPQGNVADTMVRHHIMYPDLPKSLGFLVGWYLAAKGARYHKDDAKAWKKNSQVSEEALWSYCARDAETTRAVWVEQKREPELICNGRYAANYHEQFEVAESVWREALRSSQVGVRYDTQAWQAAREATNATLRRLEQELSELLERPVFAQKPEKDALCVEAVLLALSAGYAMKRPFTPKRRAEALAAIDEADRAMGGLDWSSSPTIARLCTNGVTGADVWDYVCKGELPPHALLLSSSEQKADLLYKELGLPEQTKFTLSKDGERGESTSTEARLLLDLLQKIWKKTGTDTRETRVLRLLLIVGMLSRLSSTYFSAEPSPDGRWRCTLNLAGATTRRFSASKWWDKCGFNMQTLPRGDKFEQIPGIAEDEKTALGKLAKTIKRSVLPLEDDHVLLNFDLEQAESRVVAHESADAQLLADFDSGGDFHSQGAMLIFGYRNEAAVPKVVRQQTKIARHGWPYGMSVARLALEMRIPTSEATRVIEKLVKLYPGIERWHGAIERRLIKELPIMNGLGWPRLYMKDPRTNAALRAMFAHVPQSTIPALVNRAWVKVASRVRKFGGEVLLQTHDALLMSVPRVHWKRIARFVLAALEEPVATTLIGKHNTPDGQKFRAEYVIPASGEIGDNYGEMRRFTRDEIARKAESAESR
jgi:hypothetical protein